jgi:hypothetical protein
MDFQELLFRTLTPKQKEKRKLEKELIADFNEYAENCKAQGIKANIEGYCRVISEERNISPRTIRRVLIVNNVVEEKKRNGKSSKDTENGIADRSLSTGNGSTNDGNCSMHAV